MRPIYRLLLVLVITALSSCRSAVEPNTVTAVDVQLTRLQEKDSVSFLNASTLHAPERIIVRSDDEWRELWLRLWGHAPGLPVLPAVDFSRELLIVAAAGDVGSSGYDILLDGVTIQQDRLIVRVRSISPGPTCGVYWVMMQPVDVARISRTALPIEFDERSEKRVCP